MTEELTTNEPTTKQKLSFMAALERISKENKCKLAAGVDSQGKVVFALRNWNPEETPFNS